MRYALSPVRKTRGRPLIQRLAKRAGIAAAASITRTVSATRS